MPADLRVGQTVWVYCEIFPEVLGSRGSWWLPGGIDCFDLEADPPLVHVICERGRSPYAVTHLSCVVNHLWAPFEHVKSEEEYVAMLLAR